MDHNFLGNYSAQAQRTAAMKLAIRRYRKRIVDWVLGLKYLVE
jgi:hypothetical protein